MHCVVFVAELMRHFTQTTQRIPSVTSWKVTNIASQPVFGVKYTTWMISVFFDKIGIQVNSLLVKSASAHCTTFGVKVAALLRHYGEAIKTHSDVILHSDPPPTVLSFLVKFESSVLCILVA